MWDRIMPGSVLTMVGSNPFFNGRVLAQYFTKDKCVFSQLIISNHLLLGEMVKVIYPAITRS